MESFEQVVLVIKFTLMVVPPSLYLIVLGLIYSRMEPFIISQKKDWLILVGIFSSVVGYPVISFLAKGDYFTGLILLIFTASVVLVTAPKESSGWVVYNAQVRSVEKAIEKSLRGLSIKFTRRGNTFVFDGNMLKVSGYDLLRSVSVNIQGGVGEDVLDKLRLELANDKEVMMEGYRVGPILLITGTGLFLLPIFAMIRHVNAFVEVFSGLLAG